MDMLAGAVHSRAIRIPWILNRFLSVEYTTEKLYKNMLKCPTYGKWLSTH
jgi:hypothetical protein